MSTRRNPEGIEGKDYAWAVSLDSLGLMVPGPVVLKLDVEGHECDALHGATEFSPTKTKPSTP